MFPNFRKGLAGSAFAALLSIAASPVSASDFYAGKTITLICPYAPGGTYDRMSRLAAQYLPRHIPGNPTIIVQNRPGGGGVIGIRNAYRAEPDGLTIVHFASTTVVQKLTGSIPDIDFEKFNTLGSVGGAHYIFFLRTDRKERSIADLRSADPPIRVGIAGPSSLLTQAAKFLQRAGKFNFTLVPGYAGFSPIALAARQNEVDGGATAAAAMAVNSVAREMLKDGTAKLILSMGGAPPHKDVAEEVATLPKFIDGIEDPLDKQAYIAFSGLLDASRPFATSPGVPAERVAILRKAMEAMMADPEFIETATKQGFVLNPLGGDKAQDLILSIFKLPAEMQERLKELLK